MPVDTPAQLPGTLTESTPLGGGTDSVGQAISHMQTLASSEEARAQYARMRQAQAGWSELDTFDGAFDAALGDGNDLISDWTN